jgi:hypothetical protein
MAEVRELVREEASSAFLFSPFDVAAGVNKHKQLECMYSCCVRRRGRGLVVGARRGGGAGGLDKFVYYLKKVLYSEHLSHFFG